MKTMKNPILLGKIGAPHGVTGQLRVTSFTANPLAIADYGALVTDNGDLLEITKKRPSKNVLVVSFKGINTREAAEKLRGQQLYVERTILPNIDDDEFYVRDLIGMRVCNENSDVFGKIIAVPNFGAGDLLEIAPQISEERFGSKTWFLAFTKATVPNVDFDKNQVTIIQPDHISERDEDDG